MKIFEKVKINLKNGKSRQIWFCGIPLLQYDKINNQKKYCCPIIKKRYINKNKPVVYLKVNRGDYLSFVCIQHWIDIVDKLGYDYYILSDKKDLNKKILKKIIFHNSDIKFIKSCKNNYLKNIVKNIASRCWVNATYAHLSTYYHAMKNNLNCFWNIDADDTMFLLDSVKSSELLKIAEQYAKNNSIENFSLDMHRSNICGHHWSFGITYTSNPEKWLKIYSKNHSKKWQTKYLHWDQNFNLDWYMTYLKDTDYNKFIEAFYFENLYFAHWNNLSTLFFGITIYHWLNNRLEYPILKTLFKIKDLDERAIYKDVIGLNMNLKNEDYEEFYKNKIINSEFLQHIYKVWAGN